MSKPQLILGMPEKEYHELDRLSASGIKLLLAGPYEYWYDTYGPGKQQASTPAQDRGTYTHTGAVEGWDVFMRRYEKAMAKEDYPEALITQEHMKDWLKERGVKTSGTKAELSARIHAQCVLFKENPPMIWADVEREQQEDAEALGLELISADDWDYALEKTNQVSPILAEARDADGEPEVTILFENGGIPCKARLDYLSPGYVWDLKNVANKYRQPFEDVISKEMANRFLTIQAEWYLMAANVAMADGLLPFDWSGDFDFKWIFCQSNGVPNIAVRRYLQSAISIEDGKRHETAVSAMTRNAIGKAMGIYQQYQKSHGKDRPWKPPLDEKDMRDEDYPGWWLMKGDW